jgi:hypothetical protein
MFDHDDSATAAGYAEARKEKANHTPGPWRYNSDPRGAQFGVHVFLNEIDSFALGVGGGPDEQVAEDLANARLIAAAPDLLDACREAFRMVRNCPGNWEQGVAEKLAAAIIKATPPPPVSTADMAANHAMGDGE